MLWPALQTDEESIEKSESLLRDTGFQIILVVITSTFLSLIRLCTWKGKSFDVEAKRYAGSNVTRAELMVLEQTVKELEQTVKQLRPNVGNDVDDATTEAITYEEPKKPFEPEQKGQLLFRLVLVCISSTSVSGSIWLGMSCSNMSLQLDHSFKTDDSVVLIFVGFRSFSHTFRLAARAFSSSLPDPSCESYYDLVNEFSYWVLSLLICLPCLNYFLYVMSRGTSYYETMIQIFFPFITKRREASITENETSRVARIKKYWVITDDFVVCSRRLKARLRNWPDCVSCVRPSPEFLYKGWSWALWVIPWILIGSFVQQFVTRGVVQAQWFVGGIPRGWTCFITSNRESPCSSASTATSESNISDTDILYCFRFRKATFGTDSDLTEAFSIGFGIYVAGVVGLRIAFKMLAKICLDRGKKHPDKKATWFGAVVVIVILFVYNLLLWISVPSLPQLFLYSDGLIGSTILTGLLMLITLPFLVICSEVGLTENDIEWRYFKLPEPKSPGRRNSNTEPGTGSQLQQSASHQNEVD